MPLAVMCLNSALAVVLKPTERIYTIFPQGSVNGQSDTHRFHILGRMFMLTVFTQNGNAAYCHVQLYLCKAGSQDFLRRS